MKLYYTPGACSLSPHIVLREAGYDFELVRVDLAAKTLPDGGDFRAICPMGYVPALQLDDGEVLTEGAAIIQYLADDSPAAGLLPAAGTRERARAVSFVAFVNAEAHKAFSPLFDPRSSEDGKAAARQAVIRRLDHLEAILADGRRHAVGETFTIADAQLYAVVRWAGPTGIGFDAWPNLKRVLDRIEARPHVQAALAAEAA
ncbi:glutathione transferase GstA [Phenylobacterium sp.]|jgi:glutathione S-transferase|uniref:glutathione transferase GstA n=1 Tax=Phenylobacterium sp. TaxID=1871053 RepID=UPI0035B0E1F1